MGGGGRREREKRERERERERGYPNSLVPDPLRGGGVPVCGPRFLPGEGVPLSMVLGTFGGGGERSTPVRTSTWTPPPPLARTRTLSPPPPPPTRHAMERIRHGRYASCGHAGERPDLQLFFFHNRDRSGNDNEVDNCFGPFYTHSHGLGSQIRSLILPAPSPRV